MDQYQFHQPVGDSISAKHDSRQENHDPYAEYRMAASVGNRFSPPERQQYVPAFDPRYSPESQRYGYPTQRPVAQEMPQFPTQESPYHFRTKEGPVQGRRHAPILPYEQQLPSPEQLADSVLRSGRINRDMYTACNATYYQNGPYAVRDLVRKINENLQGTPYQYECISQYDNQGRERLVVNLIDKRAGYDMHGRPLYRGTIYLR